MLSILLEYLRQNESGLDHAHANLSPVPESNLAQKTNATYGPSSASLSASVALQSSLVSKLRQRLDANGSQEYELTWKEWDMQSGPPICALRASARRISDKGSFGWQTPTVQDAHGRDRHNQRNGTVILSLLGEARVAGWATPTTRDHKDGSSVGTAPTNGLLGRQVWLSPAPMGSRGALNPALPRWLMGFPPAWCDCAVTATQSSHKSQRNL